MKKNDSAMVARLYLSSLKLARIIIMRIPDYIYIFELTIASYSHSDFQQRLS